MIVSVNVVRKAIIGVAFAATMAGIVALFALTPHMH